MLNFRPAFHSRPDSLTLADARYLQDLLYRAVKIGTELEFALPKGVLREEFQPRIEEALQPSGDMNKLGELGVYDVIREHCGIEILVIGRHPHWDALLNQYNRIILPLLAEKIRMRPTCGLHFHILGTGLSEEIPEIILANFWNMARLFAPGLKFITSAGKNRQALCRRRQHNAHQEFMHLSPEKHSMAEVQAVLKKSMVVPEHQNFFNIEHVRFNESGNIINFHLEFRFPDGDLCPVSITAKTFLFMTMMLKAVEISKFGLLKVDSCSFMETNNRLVDMISNNDGKLATSDTSAIDDTGLKEYRNNAQSLLFFLKSIFFLLDNPSELVLQQLASEPISLRRDQGKSWEEIEDELLSHIHPSPALDNFDYELIKVIELGLLTGIDTKTCWLEGAAQFLHLPVSEISERLQGYQNRSPVWQKELGSIVFLR
ncbi:Amidoligase enzyme [Candidatus Electrothrix laxa]